VGSEQRGVGDARRTGWRQANLRGGVAGAGAGLSVTLRCAVTPSC
jgi:hypothetical protein